MLQDFFASGAWAVVDDDCGDNYAEEAIPMVICCSCCRSWS